MAHPWDSVASSSDRQSSSHSSRSGDGRELAATRRFRRLTPAGKRPSTLEADLFAPPAAWFEFDDVPEQLCVRLWRFA